MMPIHTIMSLSPKPVIGCRRFAMSPYIADERDRLRPVQPKCCPEAEAGDGACHLHVERWRERVHGPAFLLLALYCLTHDRSFTVYPLGWPPYSRSPVTPIDHCGRLLASANKEDGWRETVFDALVDASSGDLWPDAVTLGPTPSPIDNTGPPPRCRKTQRRHVRGAICLFALDQAAARREREWVAQTHNLDLLPLEMAARRIRDGPSLKVRGEEGVKVLKQLPAAAITVFGLLALGVRRGFWGPPLL